MASRNGVWHGIYINHESCSTSMVMLKAVAVKETRLFNQGIERMSRSQWVCTYAYKQSVSKNISHLDKTTDSSHCHKTATRPVASTG
jgi:hypothetical protein